MTAHPIHKGFLQLLGHREQDGLILYLHPHSYSTFPSDKAQYTTVPGIEFLVFSVGYTRISIPTPEAILPAAFLSLTISFPWCSTVSSITMMSTSESGVSPPRAYEPKRMILRGQH